MKDEKLAADLTDWEYERVCATPKCEAAAKWVGWVSHSAKGCPNSSFACDACKSTVTMWWTSVLASTDTHDVGCAKCRQPLEGSLTDHLRWLPL